MKHSFAILFAAILSSPFLAGAQSPNEWIPLRLPADDDFVPEDRTNWFLPQAQHEPAGSHGYLRVDTDGHFRFVDGTPIRFVGVSLVAAGAFPDSITARMIAKRLAKFGVNLVRLHHIDNSWSSSGRESLIQPGADTRHLNPQQLERLDYLIHQLALHGIYICISLNSARQFLPGDGVAHADEIPRNGKIVSLFEPRLLFLQKEFATNLLSYHNPYTGQRYADDPRIALLEIGNENTLYLAWKQDLLNGRRVYNNGLSLFHQRMLDSLWHDFLRSKYGNTDAIRQAWLTGTIDTTQNNLLRNGDFEQPLGTEWILEQHGNANALLSLSSSAARGNAAARVEVAAATNSLWDIQLKQVGMPIKKDSTHTLRFWAKSPFPQPMRVALVQDDMPSESLGLEQTLFLQSGLIWQSYTLTFTATRTNLVNARLTFALSATKNTIWFDDIQLHRTYMLGLLPEEDLEASNIRRIEHRERRNFSPARVRDTAEFYESLERKFFVEMYRHLKDDLGAKALITANNIYGGPADAKAKAIADYLDHHAYWDHPQYPTQPFSRTDWLITNLPMVRHPLVSGTTIPALAANAVAGKPFTVSEYQHPFPNQYQAEAIPFLAAYGSLQDWDALALFCYHQDLGSWLPLTINDHFQIDGNPLMMAMLPQLSHIFRNRLIQSAQREILLQYTRDEIYRYDAEATGLLGVQGKLPETIAFVHRLRIGSFDAPQQLQASDYAVSPPASPYRSDTGEIEWDDQAGILKVETPQVVMLSGFLDAQSVATEKLEVLSSSYFGTILWTSTDVASLASTDKSLMTIVTRVENSFMGWNGDHTKLNSWGGYPVRMEPQKLLLEIKLPVDSLWVLPLDSLGQAGEHFSLKPDPSGVIRFPLDQRRTKTVWFGIRHFNKTTLVEQTESSPPLQFSLSQSYPNPVFVGEAKVTNGAGSGLVSVRFTLPKESVTTLVLYDLEGREVKRLVDGRFAAGAHTVSFMIKDLPSGIYFYRLHAGVQQAMRKILVVR
ncbi:carbohydrate binding domain-containing protein [candidate division KSB1 bacterium]|nr:carbohydrate binding domain-containing protein [candidate division KSB1 bacterium]